MRTGMLAAEAAFDAVRAGDTSAAALRRYQQKIDDSPIRSRALSGAQRAPGVCGRPLWPVRRSSGVAGSDPGDARLVGRGPAGPSWTRADEARSTGSTASTSRPTAEQRRRTRSTGRKLTFDKVTNVHYSARLHDEDQPLHLLVRTEVCSSICGAEHGHPCTRFCPANVYEIVREADGTQAPADQRVELRALQDVRHHGSLPGDHLGPAGGRRGPQYNGM